MINFRFHIASLIAVFLALALGIFVGSTVIDQAIVENLDRQIDRVERKADERKAENDRLKSDLDIVAAYMEDSAPFTVASRLVAVPVAVLAERGIDGDVRSTVELLREAGAAAPDIVWLEPAWRLSDQGDVESLARALGASTTADPATLRSDGLRALVESLAASRSVSGAPSSRRGESSTSNGAGGRGEPTASTAVPGGPDLLSTLAKAGFISVEDIGGADETPGDGSGEGASSRAAEDVRFLLVGGSESDLFDTGVLMDLARACVAQGVAAVAAEVHVEVDGGPDRGTAVSPIAADGVVGESVTTVDDLDLPEGRVSTVIALEGLADGTVGHYGYGSGASRSFPEWAGQ